MNLARLHEVDGNDLAGLGKTTLYSEYKIALPVEQPLLVLNLARLHDVGGSALWRDGTGLVASQWC